MDKKACDNLKSILRSRYEASGMPVERAAESVEVVATIEEYFASDVGGEECFVFGAECFDVDLLVDTLQRIRDRPDVQDVLMHISDPCFNDPDWWPSSDTAYVLTPRLPDEVLSWIDERHRRLVEDVDEGFWCDETPIGAPTLQPGFRVVKVWWG